MSKAIEYVIAIKRIKDYHGNIIPESDQPWFFPSQEYFLDDPVGYIWRDYNENTIAFVSELEATVWWEVCKSSLKPYINDYYNPETLCIQKRTTVIETENIKDVAF